MFRENVLVFGYSLDPRGTNRCTGLLLPVPSRDPRELAFREAEAKAPVCSTCKLYFTLATALSHGNGDSMAAIRPV